MTAVGKILAFFNLIFSLIVGALVVVVYSTQTHWHAAYDDLAKSYQVDEASLKAYQDQEANANDYTSKFNAKVLGDKELGDLIDLPGLIKDVPGSENDPTAKLKRIKEVIKAAQADRDAAKADADKARADLTAAQKKIDAADATITSTRAEVEKRQAESETNKKLLKDETDKNLKLVVDMGKEHDDKVAWKIRADSAELREKELEKENDKLARDNQKLIANGGTLTATTTKKEGPNPPADSVEGLISEVSDSGLVSITIGSDAGLAVGNTLEVYRLNTQAPDQSKYLGRIKIVKVSATQAVGQPMTKSPVPLQAGDTVSSRISGG